MSALLGAANAGPAALRALLADPAARPVTAVGAYDALSARLVEAAGFPAVYVTGSAPRPASSADPTPVC
jgi:2-methylisocitrate lyase-like PEP mutase family enzyme